MFKKVILILVVLFSIQVLISCIFCDCPDPETFNISYSSVEVTAMNTAGFSPTAVTDSVYKNAFGLLVYMNSDYTLIQTATPNFTLGFSTVTACSCDENTYLYPDPLSYMNVFVVNTDTDERTDVTENFKIQSYYYDGLINLNEFFSERENWYDGFQFELVDFNSIPSSAIFVVEAHLLSGIMLSRETQQINFYH
jgi:hypothetical protein